MSDRQERFRRNPQLEFLLEELNSLLEPAETPIRARFQQASKPVIFVVGPPRSGTTLMMQWLASTGQFAYPSNLLSRFFAAPYIGAMIQKLLFDSRFQFGDELSLGTPLSLKYASEIGKTAGILEPNEFWYFWRRFIPNDQPRPLSDSELASIDKEGFRSGVASLMTAFEKPWAMKGIILQYNLQFLNRLFDKVLFVHTKRDEFDNIASLLDARRKYFGTIDQWFSVQPPGTSKLKGRSPHEQVAGQVILTNESIESELSEIDQDRHLTIPHEQFCKSPAKFYKRLQQRLLAQGFELDSAYDGPPDFTMHSRTSEDAKQIQTAISTIREEQAELLAKHDEH